MSKEQEIANWEEAMQVLEQLTTPEADEAAAYAATQIEKIQNRKFWIHKMHVQQLYGGPEEGGWWYDQSTPIDPQSDEYMPPVYFLEEEEAYAACRALNGEEKVRREAGSYGYTSVLSYRETFYDYTIQESETPHPEPDHRPHYE